MTLQRRWNMVINGFGECASSEAMHHAMIYVTRIPSVYPSVFPCVCSFDRLSVDVQPYVFLCIPQYAPRYAPLF